MYNNDKIDAITYTNETIITDCSVNTQIKIPTKSVTALIISHIDWYSICSYALNKDVKTPEKALIITEDPIRYTTIFVKASNVPILTKSIRALIVTIDNISFILPWFPRYL